MRAGPKICVEMDSNIVQLGQFQSGHHVTKCFTLHNMGDEDQLVSISFGQSNSFGSEALIHSDHLPFYLSPNEIIPNSAKNSKSWYLRKSDGQETKI